MNIKKRIIRALGGFTASDIDWANRPREVTVCEGDLVLAGPDIRIMEVEVRGNLIISPEASRVMIDRIYIGEREPATVPMTTASAGFRGDRGQRNLLRPSINRGHVPPRTVRVCLNDLQLPNQPLPVNERMRSSR